MFYSSFPPSSWITCQLMLFLPGYIQKQRGKRIHALAGNSHVLWLRICFIISVRWAAVFKKENVFLCLCVPTCAAVSVSSCNLLCLLLITLSKQNGCIGGALWTGHLVGNPKAVWASTHRQRWFHSFREGNCHCGWINISCLSGEASSPSPGFHLPVQQTHQSLRFSPFSSFCGTNTNALRKDRSAGLHSQWNNKDAFDLDY